MASWSELSTGTRSGAVAVIVALLFGGGYGLWQANQPAPVPAADPAKLADTAETEVDGARADKGDTK